MMFALAFCRTSERNRMAPGMPAAQRAHWMRIQAFGPVLATQSCEISRASRSARSRLQWGRSSVCSLHKRRDVMPIRLPDTLGDCEERYWSPVNSPILGDDGRVAYVVHQVEDVTKVMQLEREKLDQDTLLEAARTRSERYQQ